MIIAKIGEGASGSAVIATRPPNAPLSIITTSVLPVTNLEITAHAITPAPAAIIFSLEGVFATIAAWFILNQILDVNNLLGCFFILCGVLLSQLLPLIKKKYT